VADFTEITSGLQFPEGPVAMADGSVLVAEMFGQRVTRVLPDGSKVTVAEVPGGPNGLAIGPDGALYVCNNGGCFSAIERDGRTYPGPFDADCYIGGRVQRIDLVTGQITDLYTECDGHPLRGPNDLVFDDHGGFYFTDHGIRMARTSDLTGVYYAQPDGSQITEVVFPTEAPNGIGLSPDGSTLYWAETHTGRVFARRVVEPGVVEGGPGLASLLCGLPGAQLLDSLAIDGAGNVCVATLIRGGITVIGPDGEVHDFVDTGDRMTTNICFGGADRTTAFVTCSGSGTLLAAGWPIPGLQLAFNA
jgi:gluconolactonase